MRSISPLFVLLGMAACFPVKTEHVLTGVPGAAYTGTVKVVMDGVPLRDGYEEVAIVSATGGGHTASLPAIVGALQDEAARLGCDAVIGVRYDRGAETATGTGVAVRLK